MSKIQFGDGEPFEVSDVEIDYEPDEGKYTHMSFGELKIDNTRIDFPAIHMNPETARLLLGGPVHRPVRTIALQFPGRRYWWKPWRRRPGCTLHLNAVAVWPWPTGETDA